MLQGHLHRFQQLASVSSHYGLSARVLQAGHGEHAVPVHCSLGQDCARRGARAVGRLEQIRRDLQDERSYREHGDDVSPGAEEE